MLRRQLAEEENVPPYVIFTDATLQEKVRIKPRNKMEMLLVSGVGAKKFERDGEQFLALTKAANPRPLPAMPPKTTRNAEPAREVHEHRLPNRAKRAANGRQLTPSLIATLEIASEGVPVADVAKERGLATSTVASHMAELIACGEITDISPWVDEVTLAQIRNTAGEGPITTIGPLKEQLGETVTYEQLHLARTWLNVQIRDQV
jgi:ATP-dependent DNA helicase RecQ